jgi:hypothetical protein
MVVGMKAVKAGIQLMLKLIAFRGSESMPIVGLQMLYRWDMPWLASKLSLQNRSRQVLFIEK